MDRVLRLGAVNLGPRDITVARSVVEPRGGGLLEEVHPMIDMLRANAAQGTASPPTLSPPASDAIATTSSAGRRSGAASVPGPRPFPSARRRPPHPGRFLDEHYLGPLRITQDSLARALGVSRRRVNEIVRGRRGLTPDTAIRLAQVFGGDPAFWLNLQAAWDLHAAIRRQKPKAARD